MFHCKFYDHFVPVAVTSVASAAAIAISALVSSAAAQTAPAASPVVVYVAPPGPTQYVTAPAAPAPAPQPLPRPSEQPVANLASPAESTAVAKTAYQAPAESNGAKQPGTLPDPAADGEYAGCIDGCDTCCGPWLRCVAGMELTWVAPSIDDGELSARLTDTAGIGRTVSYTMDDFDTEPVEIAPRFWLGLQGECWGVVSRVWWLDAAEMEHSIFTGGSDVGYDFGTELDMYTIDLEVTRNFWYGCNGLGQATFGVRHARAERDGSLDFVGETPDGMFSSMARFGQTFEGTGLTGSLTCLKPVWCGSCLHWFCGVRGSILWGDSAIYSDTSAISDGAAGISARNTAVAGRDDELFIGEVQLGLQVQQCLQCVPATVFLRTAFEFQTWSAPSGSTEALSFVGTGTSLLTTRAATDGVDVNLFGFGIATGLNW